MPLKGLLVSFVVISLIFVDSGQFSVPSEANEYLQLTRKSESGSTAHNTITLLSSQRIAANGVSISNSGLSEEKDRSDSLTIEPVDPAQPGNISPDILDQSQQSKVGKIEATIINPFRSAAIAAEVSGIIEQYSFEVGDHVAEGMTIAEISKRRYSLLVERAKQNVDAIRVALKRAYKDKEIKQKLVSMDASSVQELLRSEAEVEITEAKLQEAEISLKQARLDLDSCQVKAPFSGYLAIRYKEPFEAVGPLEKMFMLVDSSKVYAVAYVPENLMPFFGKGSKATFSDPSGRHFIGEVDKIEPIIDPKTGTRKVYVLMDNAEKQLGIGMSGSLESAQ